MAVHTRLCLKEITPLLRSYTTIGQPKVLTAISTGTANTNYQLATTTGQYVFTLFEDAAEAQQITWLTPYLQYLKDYGLPVTSPLAAQNGSYTQTYQNKTCILTPFLNGSEKPITPKTAFAAGALLAQFTKASAAYSNTTYKTAPPHPWHPQFIKHYFNALKPQNLPKSYAPLLKALQREVNLFTEEKALPQGIIHADFFPDNILFVGAEPTGLIDFYKAGQDAFAYDFAMALCAWGFEDDDTFNETNFHSFSHGYQNTKPLSTPEKAAMLRLFKRACCVIMIMRLLSWQKGRTDGITPRPPEAFYKRYLFLKEQKNWMHFLD